MHSSNINPLEALFFVTISIYVFVRYPLATISNEETFLLDFSNNSEAFPSKLQENLEEMFP